MLLLIVVVLVILWALGFFAQVGGSFIHLVLLVALIVLIYDLLTRSRRNV